MKSLKQLFGWILGWAFHLAFALALPTSALLCIRNAEVIQFQSEAANQLAKVQNKITIETSGFVFIAVPSEGPQNASLAPKDWRTGAYARIGTSAPRDPAPAMRANADWSQRLTWLLAAWSRHLIWLLPLLFVAGLSVRWMSRWPVLLLASFLITCGFFAAINNEMVRWWGSPDPRLGAVEGQPPAPGDTKEPNFYRSGFFERFGYDPAAPGDLQRGIKTFEVETNSFLSSDEGRDLDEVLDESKNVGFLPDLGLPKGVSKSASLKKVLEMDDRQLVAKLEQHFRISTSLWPRPSSTLVGYNDPYNATVTRTPWQHAPVGTPSFASLVQMLRGVSRDPILEAKPNDSRIDTPPPGLRLLARLHRRQMDEMQNLPMTAVARRANGLFQWITLYIFFVGILLVRGRFHRGVSGVRKSLSRCLPPSSPDFTISIATARGEWNALDGERNQTGFNGDGVKEMVYAAYQSLAAKASKQEAIEALDRSAERLQNRVDFQYGVINYCVWLVPALGFAGTTFFLSMALFEARLLGEGDVMQGLQRTMASLGLKFDTTFVALCNAIVLHFIATIVRGREESAIEEARNRVQYDLISRFVGEGPPHETPAAVSPPKEPAHQAGPAATNGSTPPIATNGADAHAPAAPEVDALAPGEAPSTARPRAGEDAVATKENAE